MRTGADRTHDIPLDDLVDDTVDAIARSAVDVTARMQGRPDDGTLWRELADAGWLSMLVPEHDGGLGLALRHVVALHRELGRMPIAAPVLACGLLPSALLVALPRSERRDALLRDLQHGDVRIGVAWQDETGQLSPRARSAVDSATRDGQEQLTGTKAWPQSAAHVDAWIVDATTTDGTRRLLVVDGNGVTTVPTRTVEGASVARLELAGVSPTASLAEGAAAVDALSDALDIARIAQAAELMGVCRASFDLTLDYMKTRVQFDRPIGANQALQHRMVDAWIRVEMAEAGLAAAVDAHLRGGLSLAQAASAVKARSAEVALLVTRLAVQMHGAIGLTDEYALGRYWKRAQVLAAWLGNAARHQRRHLDLHERNDATRDADAPPAPVDGDWRTADVAAFRSIVRTFLRASYPPDLRHPPRRLRLGEVAGWYRTLAQKGWLAPAWPQEHGGMGLPPEKLIAFVEEFEAFGAARLPDQGVINLGPILIRHGTDAQRRRYLPKILSGEEIWCQGYSEPDAGSDLASLRTRATLEGDHFRVNGQKIWSTLAHDATHMFMLARTSTEARKHDGISFLLVDLSTPGVTVRPIRNVGGEEEFCEIFLDDVMVPAENLVGAMGQGWRIGMALLGFERLFVGSPKTCEHALAQLRRLGEARGVSDDPQFRATYGGLLLDLVELRAAFARFARLAGRGDELPPAVSMLKVWATETYGRIASQLVSLADEDGATAGAVALPDDEPVTPFAALLNASMTTIYAGSNEIQKNILAKRVLGLPG